MSRINCHSAFKHYEMFHSRGGDVINIGSNNTTIFNCGGSHLGGFWGGFGLGLGNAFGSLFGGGMGFGGFGMGGFGFPGFGGFGMFNWGGGGSYRVNDNATTKTVTKEVVKEVVKDDPDCAKITDITGKIKSLPKNPDKATLNAIIKDIDDAIEALDDNNKPSQKKTLENLKAQLQQMVEAATVDPNPDQAQPVDVTPVDNFETKLNAAGNDPDKLLALLEATTDPAQRAQIKAKFYEDGYSNYDGKTELKDGDVVRAHDNSGKTRDTNQASGKAQSTITKSDNGSHPQTIVIHDRKDITYTYKATVDGEYIYTSNQDNQDYVLQKNTNGKYDLMQYNYHKGYGVKDWN